MKKKSFVYGAIILGLSAIICKILGAIFRIPLTSLLGAEGVGIYQLVYPIFALCLVASSSGIPVAISKIVSKEYSGENFKNIKKIFNNSLKIMIFLGVFFAFLIVLLCKPIARLQGNSNLWICYVALSPSIILGSIISCYRGYFQGFEIMKHSAISQIVEQLLKLIFGLLFAYIFLKFGLIFGVFGAFFGIFLSEFFAFLYLFFVYKSKDLNIDFSTNKSEIYSNKQALSMIIKESIPITLTAIIVPFLGVIDSLIITKLLSVSGFDFEVSSILYGLDSGVVSSLINLPIAFVVSISVSLMPSISSSFALKNDTDISFKSKFAIKIVWYFTIPCAILFFFLSKEICYFLYGNLSSNLIDQLNCASIMLKIGSFSIIYIALNQILTTILQATNESYYSFYVLLFSSIIKIILTIVLVVDKNINIYGLVIADVVCYALSAILNMAKVRKKIRLKFDFYEILIVPLFGAILMTGSVLLFKSVVLSNLNRLLILLACVVSFVIYVLSIVLLKGFSEKEIKNTKFLNFIKHRKY
ncbi:MAG: oligosaccharide flippase family protein [Christensenellales bacterium]